MNLLATPNTSDISPGSFVQSPDSRPLRRFLDLLARVGKSVDVEVEVAAASRCSA